MAKWSNAGRDEQVLEWLREEFPINLPKGSLELKMETNRRQVLIQRYIKANGDYRTVFGVRYGPFYTHGKALEALRLDKKDNPHLYLDR